MPSKAYCWHNRHKLGLRKLSQNLSLIEKAREEDEVKEEEEEEEEEMLKGQHKITVIQSSDVKHEDEDSHDSDEEKMEDARGDEDKD